MSAVRPPSPMRWGYACWLPSTRAPIAQQLFGSTLDRSPLRRALLRQHPAGSGCRLAAGRGLTLVPPWCWTATGGVAEDFLPLGPAWTKSDLRPRCVWPRSGRSIVSAWTAVGRAAPGDLEPWRGDSRQEGRAPCAARCQLWPAGHAWLGLGRRCRAEAIDARRLGQALFGVDASQPASSKLRVHSVRAGVASAGVFAQAQVPLDSDWTFSARMGLRSFTPTMPATALRRF